MHINIIKHFLKNNLEQIISDSLINCHTVGVDSIVFDNTDESRIRLFIAHAKHDLWKNYSLLKKEYEPSMSIALHPHRCNISLEVIKGRIENITAYPTAIEEHMAYKDLNKFLYKSKILDGVSGFQLIDGGHNFKTEHKTLDFDRPKINLSSKNLHTIYVEQGRPAAWFVYEGKIDPEYEPVCYSNADLESLDTKELYQKMSHTYFCNLIKDVFGIDIGVII